MNAWSRFREWLPWVVLGTAAAVILWVMSPGAMTPGRISEAKVHAPTSIGELRVSFAAAVDAATPAVVNIHTARSISRQPSPLLSDPFFKRFFGDTLPAPAQRMETSLGSGVIMHQDGYILTNNHVVKGADEIRVLLQDGRGARAEVVGADVETDLAVLRVTLPNLPSIGIRPRSQLRVGDVVLAIGNPFGVGQTVTMGIISATGRTRLGLNTFEDFIQTDAAINPGNSGGPLVDASGRLVGINTAIFSRTGGSQGIGFAIPAPLAIDVMNQIVRQGFVARGWLGIEIRPLTEPLARELSLNSSSGVLIARVMQGGPGAQAGLSPGDVIAKVGGVRMAHPSRRGQRDLRYQAG